MTDNPFRAFNLARPQDYANIYAPLCDCTSCAGYRDWVASLDSEGVDVTAGRADADIAPTPRASSIAIGSPALDYEPVAAPIDYDPWAGKLCQARARAKMKAVDVRVNSVNNGRLQFIKGIDDPKGRKEYPVATGLLDYFPDALAEVANVSWVATQQHHPGEEMHWDRTKSTDEDNTTMRHFMQRGQRDTDGVRHRAKVAWRSLAALQKEIEEEALKGAGASATTGGAAQGPSPSQRETFRKARAEIERTDPGSFPKHPLRK